MPPPCRIRDSTSWSRHSIHVFASRVTPRKAIATVVAFAALRFVAPQWRQAVASVLPLAQDVSHPVAYMQVGGTEVPYRSALQRETMQVLAREGVAGEQAEGVERFAFYERVKKAYAIVVTGELQPFGNFLLRKGVIGETLRD